MSPRALVTGASRGIGLEYARQWAEAGARVFALARDPAESRGLTELVARIPDRVVPVPCDVADDESVDAARRRVGEATDGLEILVNNGRVTERILDPDSTGELADVIAESSFDGMQTFDQHLLALVREGLVSEEDARAVATNPHDLGLAVTAAMAEPPASVGSYASEGV